MIYKMDIGQRVELARRRKSWSQAQLAEAANTQQTTVSKIERGESRGKRKLGSIADALDVPVEWLINGSNPPSWARLLPQDEPEPFGAESMHYVGKVDAGAGRDAKRLQEQASTEELYPVRLKSGLMVARVCGTSGHPIVTPGQYVAFDPDAEPSHGELVVAFCDEGQPDHRAIIKRYLIDKHLPHGFALVSPDIGSEIWTFGNQKDPPRCHPIEAILSKHALEGLPYGV